MSSLTLVKTYRLATKCCIAGSDHAELHVHDGQTSIRRGCERQAKCLGVCQAKSVDGASPARRACVVSQGRTEPTFQFCNFPGLGFPSIFGKSQMTIIRSYSNMSSGYDETREHRPSQLGSWCSRPSLPCQGPQYVADQWPQMDCYQDWAPLFGVDGEHEDGGVGDEQECSFFAERDRQMAGADTGGAGPLDPVQSRGNSPPAVYPCGVSSCARFPSDRLFPARRRIVVCLPSFF
ncbi:hypothetical protein PCAR4_830108 [Paraburkholderia caribensis]|nr:hypothetical protein PCAR4_830108 [Paraburkholderia caribensis]